MKIVHITLDGQQIEVPKLAVGDSQFLRLKLRTYTLRSDLVEDRLRHPILPKCY